MTLRDELNESAYRFTDAELQVMQECDDLVERLKADDPQARSELDRWIRRSPAHLKEYLLVTSLDKVIEELDEQRVYELVALFSDPVAPTAEVQSPQDAVWRPQAMAAPVERRWTSGRLAGMAAVLGVVMLGITWLAFTFGAGGDRTIDLQDGSVLAVSTGARFEVKYTAEERRIDLDEGDVLFRVAHDTARPFRVHVPGAIVQAVGTQFRLARDQREGFFWLDVVEGTVLVQLEGEAERTFELVLGQRVRIYPEGRAVEAEAMAKTGSEAISIDYRYVPLASVVSGLDALPTGQRIVLSPGARGYLFSGRLSKNDAPLLIAILRGREEEVDVAETADVIHIQLRGEMSVAR
jgi:transmembrane sensor